MCGTRVPHRLVASLANKFHCDKGLADHLTIIYKSDAEHCFCRPPALLCAP